MAEDHRAMWQQMGLDLQAHDELLAMLTNVYQEIFLSRDGRPAAMQYIDEAVAEIHGRRIAELQQVRASGGKVVGTFCIFVPEEITLAAGAVQVGLCAGAEAGYRQAETVVPANTCALIKSFLGFKLARLCPFLESCDLVVGETTCDGKKKAYEALGRLAPVHVMEVPQMKGPADRQMLKDQVLAYKRKVEELCGTAVTTDRLATAIDQVNARRRVLQRLDALRSADPCPISGLDALLVHQVSFYDDPARFCDKIGALCDELEERVRRKAGIGGRPRLVLSGCPMALPNWKVPFVLETAGAVIVGEESCVGRRNSRDLVAEDAADLDAMIEAIVERTMAIDCACFTPNDERIDHLLEMVRRLKADAVVHYGLNFCQPYAMERFKVQEALKAAGIPLLVVETDYGSADMQQLRTRAEAFVEMIAGRRQAQA